MINAWELIGRIGSINTKNCTYGGIAIDKRTLKPGTKDQYENGTAWLNYVVFGTMAANFSKIVKKGDLVRLQGECTIEVYEGKHYTKILVREFKLLRTSKTQVEPEQQTLPEEEEQKPVRIEGIKKHKESDLPF